MQVMFEKLNAHPNYFKDCDYYERKTKYYKDVARYEQEFKELKQFNDYLN